MARVAPKAKGPEPRSPSHGLTSGGHTETERPMMTPLLSVAVGGALGASARYVTGLAALRLFGAGFPWGTLTVNIVGSLLMGLAFVLIGQGGRLSPLLMTGLLGGFTTFSAFSLDAVTLYDKGAVALAGLYVIASVTLSILALIAGIALARSFTA